MSKADNANMRHEEYTLMMGNTPVLEIVTNAGYVKFLRKDLIPFDLYLEESMSTDALVMNERNFCKWCAERFIPNDRPYYSEIVSECGFDVVNTPLARRDASLVYGCKSLNDPYWLKRKSGNTEEVYHDLCGGKYTRSAIDLFINGKCSGTIDERSKIINLSATGARSKMWVADKDRLFLHKHGTKENVSKEYQVSNSLIALGFNTVRYYAGNSMSGDECYSMSERFTGCNSWFISAGSYARAHSLKDVIEYRLREFCNLLIAEYITGNSNLNGDNWGFLFDNKRNIMCVAPMFSFMHCYESKLDSVSLPMKLYSRKMTQYEAALWAISKCNIDVIQLYHRSLDPYVKVRLDSLSYR